jgi:hypothetical protein
MFRLQSSKDARLKRGIKLKKVIEDRKVYER